MKVRDFLIESLLRDHIEILLERAENDFNRLVSRNNNILFLLTGHPRSGKSSIVRKYILPKMKNVKQVNPDDISLMFTKDPNEFHKGSTFLSLQTSKNFFKNSRKDNANLVYDSTGSDTIRLGSIVAPARKSGYRVIALSVFAPLKTALKRNQEADRQVDTEYLVNSWMKAQSNIKKIFSTVRPDEHFVVMNSDDNVVWYKYDGNKIMKK